MEDTLHEDYNNFTAAIKAVKGSTNLHFKNKFTNLDTWISEIHTHAKSHNFMVLESMSPLVVAEYGVYQVHKAQLIHTSGFRLESDYVVCSVDEKPQAMGAATTYARRYNLQVLLNCTGEDDDDGIVAQATITGERPTTTLAMRRKVS